MHRAAFQNLLMAFALFSYPRHENFSFVRASFPAVGHLKQNIKTLVKYPASPVPELSFLPVSYRSWTREGEKTVQDNLHWYAQNAAIFSPTWRV